MTISKIAAALRQSTSIVSREGESLSGPRLVTDDACTVCVRAFPFAEISAAMAAGGLNVPGAYLLVGKDGFEDVVRVGETGNIARRLQEHAGDPGMSFVREVFVLTGFERKLDKQAVVYFQKRLSEKVENAGAARLIQGVAPCSADLPAWRTGPLDRMIADARQLFYDAGCRCLTPPLPTPATAVPKLVETILAPPLAPEADSATEVDEADDGPMEIGVTTVPVGVEEAALSFGDLWARGYDHEGRFVVGAGSEMRKLAVPSANEHTVNRRTRLIETGTAGEIDGVEDRYRLQVAVAFPSRAIAAKVLCGAHVGSEKWRPLCTPRPYVIAS